MAREQNEEARKIQDYLFQYFQTQVKEKGIEGARNLLGRVATKLGRSAFGTLITGEFPGSTLAKVAKAYLRWFYFEGVFALNPGENPYDPVNNEELYVEYLIWSWAHGTPGYKYIDMKALGRTVHH